MVDELSSLLLKSRHSHPSGLTGLCRLEVTKGASGPSNADAQELMEFSRPTVGALFGPTTVAVGLPLLGTRLSSLLQSHTQGEALVAHLRHRFPHRAVHSGARVVTGFGVAEVDIGVQNERLSVHRSGPDLRQLARMMLQHLLRRPGFPIREVNGSLTESGQKTRIGRVRQTGQHWNAAVPLVPLDCCTGIMPLE